MASHGQAIIESRKRADNAYRAMDTVIAGDKRIMQLANFENKTQAKIDRRKRRVSISRRIFF